MIVQDYCLIYHLVIAAIGLHLVSKCQPIHGLILIAVSIHNEDGVNNCIITFRKQQIQLMKGGKGSAEINSFY